MVVRVQAALLGLVLLAGGVRAATYEKPLPPASAAAAWSALVTARSARVVLGGTPANRGEGVVDVAARRSRMRVTGGPVPYDEVFDRSVVYVRPKPGRWYRYTATVQPSRVFMLVDGLSAADPLVPDGRATVRGLPVGRYRGASGVYVYLDADGLPRRVESADRDVHVDLYDFFGPGPVVVPPRSTPVRTLREAFTRAGLK